MNRELQVQKLVPVIIEPDQIGLNVQAVLRENDDGVDFDVPNVTFEVRLGVEKVYEGKSNAKTGIFSADQIPIGEVAGNFLEVFISANDEAGNIAIRTGISIINLMELIEKKRQMIRVNRDRQLNNDAENKRRIKAEIRGALSLISSNDVKSSEILKSAFNVLVQHQEHPETIDGVRNAVNECPKRFVEYLNLYVDAIWAKEIIRIIVHLEPGLLLTHFSDFSGRPWTREIVFEIAINDPVIFFEKIEAFEYQPWAEELAMKAVEKNYLAAIRYFALYKSQPWAKKIAVKIAENLPSVIVENFETFRSEPWIKNTLQIAVPRLIRITGTTDLFRKIVIAYAVYEEEPWCEELLAVMREKLKDSEFRDEEKQWLERAQRDPDNTASEVLSHHLDKLWAESVLRETCKHSQIAREKVCGSLNLYVAKSWGKRLFLEIIERFPWMSLHAWPTNAYALENKIIDIVLKYHKAVFERDHSLHSNELIGFCLKHPNAILTLKFIDRLKVIDSEFAKQLVKKPHGVLAFLKDLFT